MLERGQEVLAVAPDIDAHTQAALSSLGARAVSLELSNASLNPLALLASYRELARLLREAKPDLVFSYTIKPVILGALSGRAAGVSQVVSLITEIGRASC